MALAVWEGKGWSSLVLSLWSVFCDPHVLFTHPACQAYADLTAWASLMCLKEATQAHRALGSECALLGTQVECDLLTLLSCRSCATLCTADTSSTGLQFIRPVDSPMGLMYFSRMSMSSSLGPCTLVM